MVNGTSMLSSTPSSLLLSTALPTINAGAAAAGEGQATTAVPGFAELLSSLATTASGAAEASGSPGEAPAAGEPKLPTADTALAKPAKPAKPVEAAILAKAAIATGKILPVGLPEAAAASGKAKAAAPDAVPAEIAEAVIPKLPATVIDPAAAMAVSAGLPQQPAPTASESAPRGGGAVATMAVSAGLSQQPVPTAPEKAPHGDGAVIAEPGKAALPQAATLAAAGKPVAKAGEGQAADTRTTPAVAITVATQPEGPSAQVPIQTAAAEPAAIAPSKPHRADLPRGEAPLPPAAQASHSFVTVADAAPAPSAQPMPVASAPAAMPSPADINAALDRLVAAREALMPAEAALSVDHADFGEVSIRFEQSTDGRLSAELRAADPELQRAVTAAVGADRGLSMGSEGDSGRSMNLANQRGSTAGGDAAAGERGQAGNERDTNQRRGHGRPAAHEGNNDQRPGVFA